MSVAFTCGNKLLCEDHAALYFSRCFDGFRTASLVETSPDDHAVAECFGTVVFEEVRSVTTLLATETMPALRASLRTYFLTLGNDMPREVNRSFSSATRSAHNIAGPFSCKIAFKVSSTCEFGPLCDNHAACEIDVLANASLVFDPLGCSNDVTSACEEDSVALPAIMSLVIGGLTTAEVAKTFTWLITDTREVN